MNIEIQTGFEKITHSIKFNPQSEPKGKKLVESGHCRKVVEHRRDGKSYLIEGDVIPQTSPSSTAYRVKIWISDHRQIEELSCSCTYNKSFKCKHMAALIHFINTDRSETKTSREQEWDKPSNKQYVAEKYSKGRYFYQMYQDPQSLISKVESMPLTLDETNDEPSAIRIILLEAAKNKVVCAVENVIQSLLDGVEEILKEETNHLRQNECKSRLEACVETFFLYLNDYDVYSQNIGKNLNDDLLQYYQADIMMTKEEIIKLCCNTVTQSLCDIWRVERYMRMSGSKKMHSVKTRKIKSIESLVDDFLSIKSIQTASTKYGINNESIAKQLYESTNDCIVVSVGLMISPLQPWLCISLDGVVVTDESEIQKIVEIKCPSTCEKLPIIDYQKKKCNVPYLQFVNNEIILKKSHCYYTQCQVQMYVSGMSECDLFVYSPVDDGSCTCTVLRDEQFIKEVVLKGEEFYFNYFLPALYAKKIKENYDGNSEQKNSSNNAKKNVKRRFTGKSIVNLVA